MEAVLLALEAAEKVFGVEVNSLGFKVPKSCGVIQGDGINIQMLDKILQAVLARGYSAQVCAVLCMPVRRESVLLGETVMPGQTVRFAKQHMTNTCTVVCFFLHGLSSTFPVIDSEFVTMPSRRTTMILKTWGAPS